MIRYYFILHFYVGVGRGNFCDSLCPYLRSSFTKKMYTCWLNVHVCTDFAPLRTATCVHAQRKLVLNHKLLSVSTAPSASQGPSLWEPGTRAAGGGRSLPGTPGGAGLFNSNMETGRLGLGGNPAAPSTDQTPSTSRELGLWWPCFQEERSLLAPGTGQGL